MPLPLILSLTYDRYGIKWSHSFLAGRQQLGSAGKSKSLISIANSVVTPRDLLTNCTRSLNKLSLLLTLCLIIAKASPPRNSTILICHESVHSRRGPSPAETLSNNEILIDAQAPCTGRGPEQLSDGLVAGQPRIVVMEPVMCSQVGLRQLSPSRMIGDTRVRCGIIANTTIAGAGTGAVLRQ